MNVTLEQFKEGIARYIDKELANKVQGLSKWAVALAGIAIIQNSTSSLENILKALGYMSEDRMIDLDRLYEDSMKVATGSVTQHFPLIGDVIFTSADIDNLRRYIIG